jgi:hypothetical protein
MKHTDQTESPDFKNVQKMILKNFRLIFNALFSSKSIQKRVVIEIEIVVDVFDDAALDQMSAVDDGVIPISGKTDLQQPVDQVRTLENGSL